MAILSDHVYGAKPFEGWELAAALEVDSFWFHPGKAHAALYVSDERVCALLFGATGSLKECESREESKVEDNSLEECGLARVNSGMFHEFQNIILSDEWADIGDTIHDMDKCAEVLVGGHSLGGAIASMFATCANHEANNEILVPDLTRWDELTGAAVVKAGKTVKSATVSGLYTFGMPPVAKTQLSNNASEDGTFAGGRFYIEDKGCFDPVPFGCSKLGYVHPKVASIRLNESDYGLVDRLEHEAWSNVAASMPNFDRSTVGLCDTDTNYSKSEAYVSRIKRAPPQGDFTEPGHQARRLTTTPAPHDGVHLKESTGNTYHANLGTLNFANAVALPKNANASTESAARRSSAFTGWLVAPLSCFPVLIVGHWM
jgi:hypothetical protein